MIAHLKVEEATSKAKGLGLDLGQANVVAGRDRSADSEHVLADNTVLKAENRDQLVGQHTKCAWF